MAKTKKPTGLSISRSDMKFTIKWKIADKDYGNGQQLKYKYTHMKKWKNVAISSKATSKTISLSLNSFAPNKGKKGLGSITFAIRGNRKAYKSGKKIVNPGWSSWATKTLTLNPPLTPSVSASLSDSYSNVCNFSWSVSKSDTNSRIFTQCDYQAILLKESNITDGSKVSFSSKNGHYLSGTSKETGSREITEESELLAKNSYTRWLRVRARGPASTKANSPWKYAKHVYAMPYQATVSSVKTTNTSAGGLMSTVIWTSPSNASHPIDKTFLQYTITVPDANLVCPGGATWEEANTSKDTANTDGAMVSIDSNLDLDQCLYVRVNNQHDSNINYGKATLGLVGNLRDPEDMSIQTDDYTHKVTVNATNTSEVPGSFLAVVYRPNNQPSKDLIVGIIENGASSVTAQCPNWENENQIAFGVYAVEGTYKKVNRADGADSYAVTARMKSKSTLWKGGEVPHPPKNVTVTATDTAGTVRVEWDWSWNTAHSAVLSWADHDDAWESTDEPSEYTISNLHAAKWNIAGLDTGKRWYVRVCLVSGQDDSEVRSPWSEMVSIDLSSAPVIPTLTLSEAIITENSTFTASWAYSTTDGTTQAYAEICEVTTGESSFEYGDIIASTKTEQFITLDTQTLGWNVGETHQLAVRVTSNSGKVSDEWSTPVSISIAEPLTCEITENSLETITITDDEEEGITREVVALTKLPMTVTVIGAGEGGITSLIIERAVDYTMDRPDENEFNGYEGEVIFSQTQTGEEPFEIDIDDLLGNLDDEAQYRLVATVQDELGQSATDTRNFEVHWQHQALMPEAIVEIDSENYIAKITPIAPAEIEEGDTVDIYRLSTDLPELIISDGTFGTEYVDPYPAIGENGGHRVVFKTKNGDYITAENQPAWIDLREEEGDILNLDKCLIDFDGEQIELDRNIDISNSWKKDLIKTRYLGGSIQGDWNAGIERTGSLSTTTITVFDMDTILALRRLANYTGICHLRTKDGSSFPCDIQVDESRNHDDYHMLAEFELNFEVVDSEEFDGTTYEEWKVNNELE